METQPTEPPKSAKKSSSVLDFLRLFREIRYTGLVRQITSIWAGLIGLTGVIFGAFLLTPIGGDMPDVCAFYTTTHLPCPGCGLTRSVTSYFHGEFLMGFLYHPLGIGFALIFLFTAICLFLPKNLKSALREKLLPWEQNLGRAFMIFMLMMVAYGFVRIVFVAREMPGYEWWRQKETPEFALHWVAEQQPFSNSGEMEYQLIKSSQHNSITHQSGTDGSSEPAP